MKMNKLYIITGAPGTGKTALIDELVNYNVNALDEVPRKFIKGKVAEKMGFNPFEDLERFSRLVLDGMLTQYDEAKKNREISFFDRGIPDVISYLNNSEIEIPEEYTKELNRCNYSKRVFLCPPWEEIYQTDSIRPYPFQETLKLHNAIVETYRNLNYILIELPRASVKNRVKKILKEINYL